MPQAFRPHLLVVDDEAPIREALALALREGYVVHLASTGAEACAILRAQPIAAIILDEVLGDERGLGLVAQFRALSPAKILVLTGYGTENLAIRSLRAGVDDYLKKPPNLQELQAALTRMIFGVEIPPDPVVQLRIYLDEHLEEACPMEELARQAGLGERNNWGRCIFRLLVLDSYLSCPASPGSMRPTPSTM